MARIKTQPVNGNGADEKPQKNLRLIQLREWFGMGQGQVARWLDEHQSNWSLMEKGERTPPLAKLAALGINVNWLLGFDDEMWSHRVHTLRRQIRRHLTALPDTEKAGFAPPKMFYQAGRLRYVIALAKQLDPAMISDSLILALLHMDAEEYADKVQTAAEGMERSDYLRFCEYCGLSLEFMEKGEIGGLDEAEHPEYQMVISRLVAKGVTPEKLNTVLNALL